jgi:hypothetical protein
VVEQFMSGTQHCGRLRWIEFPIDNPDGERVHIAPAYIGAETRGFN